MTELYTPKPLHMVLPVALFGVGAWCLMSDIQYVVIVGVMLWVVAWIIIAWIIYADIASRRSAYWESVADAINAASKSDLERLSAIGFSSLSKDHVSVELTDTTEGKNNSQYYDLPVSPGKLQPLARAVLNGQPFTERRWSELLTSTQFRTLRGVMRDKGLIVPVSESDPRQGYTFTSAGLEVLEGIANG